jgi:hypothetical protein
MSLLFSYGSLQEADVQRSTLGRLVDGLRDELPGFETALVPISRPELVAASGKSHHANVLFNGNDQSRVRGVVFEVTDAELARIDEYEAAFSYRRLTALLASGREAWVYIHD